MADFFDFSDDLGLNRSNVFEDYNADDEIVFEEKSLNFDLLDYKDFGNIDESLDISAVNLYFMKNSSFGKVGEDVKSIKLTMPCHASFRLDFINLTNKKPVDVEVEFEFDLTSCIGRRYSFEKQSPKHIVVSNQTHRPWLGTFRGDEEGDYCIRIICKPLLLTVECTLSVHHLSLQYIPTCQPPISTSNQMDLYCFHNDKCFQPTLTFRIAHQYDCSFDLKLTLKNNRGLVEFHRSTSTADNDILPLSINRRSSIVAVRLKVYSKHWMPTANRKPIIAYSVGDGEEYSNKSFEINIKKFSTHNLSGSILQIIEPNELLPLKWARFDYRNRSQHESVRCRMRLFIADNTIELNEAEHWKCTHGQYIFLPPQCKTVVYVQLTSAFRQAFPAANSCDIRIEQFGGEGRSLTSTSKHFTLRFDV